MPDASTPPTTPPGYICPRFGDTGGFRIADLTCPVHGVNGTDPGDGPWSTEDPPGPSDTTQAPKVAHGPSQGTGGASQRLRDAARILRERANAVIAETSCGCHVGAGAAQWTYTGGDSVDLANHTGHDVITGASWGSTYMADATGTFIATMDPAVALLLADVLDSIAENFEQEQRDTPESWTETTALALADALLTATPDGAA